MENIKKHKKIKPPAICIIVLISAIAAVAAAFFACTGSKAEKPLYPDTRNEDALTDAGDTSGGTGSVTNSNSNGTGTNDDTSGDTRANDTAVNDTNANNTSASDTIADDTNADDTAAPGTEPNTGTFINPLTGTASDRDLRNSRPVAVMINNISQSLPQEGISNADIIYECTTEGLVTRLMAVMSDYESVKSLGSVRSTRPCFLELAMGHNAIIAHAGASTAAYEMIDKYRIDNLDGVNMYLPDGVFYRDEKRLETMSYEHTMMTSGRGIVSGIAYRKYLAESESGKKSAFRFADSLSDKATPSGKADKISFNYSADNRIDYIYDKENRVYLRYQYSGKPHIDGANSKQLSFTNVVVLSCIHTPSGDAERHTNIKLTGEGNGYLFTNGSIFPVIWKKSSESSELKLYYPNGEEAILNPGKTFINIVSESIFSDLKTE